MNRRVEGRNVARPADEVGFDAALASFASDPASAATAPSDAARAFFEDTGERLSLVVRRPEGRALPSMRIDASFLLGLGLRPVLEMGLLGYACRYRAVSTRGLADCLRNGICSHLREAGLDGLRIGDVDEGVLVGFAEALRRTSYRNNSRTALALAFKRAVGMFALSAEPASAERAAARSLMGSRTFRSLAARSRSRSGQVKGQVRDARKFLSPEALQAIHDAACGDVRATTRDWRRRQEERAVWREAFDPSESYQPKALRDDLALLIPWLEARYPTLLPASDAARLGDLPYHKAVLRRNIGAPGASTVIPYFYGTTSDLLPFFLLMLIRFRYNPGTLVGMRRTDVSDRGDVVVLAPRKARARDKRQVRSEPAGDPDDPLSLRSMLTMIDAMSARLRPVAPLEWRDRVFLTAAETGGGAGGTRLSTFEHLTAGVGTGAGAFFAFCRRHGLEPFAPSAIRPTILDALANGAEGLASARREGNHSERTTTLRHYVSIDTSERRRLALAETPEQMRRWAASGGDIDPRFLPRRGDPRAATPGFLCLDPYRSPLTDQPEGRLCEARGHCARCPHAILEADDPKAVAYVLAYAEAAGRTSTLEAAVADELLAGYLAFLDGVAPDVMRRAAAFPKPAARIAE